MMTLLLSLLFSLIFALAVFLVASCTDASLEIRSTCAAITFVVGFVLTTLVLSASALSSAIDQNEEQAEYNQRFRHDKPPDGVE